MGWVDSFVNTVLDLCVLGETPQGPVVKQIMDIPRCAQLREGDLIVEVNNERVTTYSHNEFITLLKRCPKGNQANFVVFRCECASRLSNEGIPPFC